MSDTTHWVERLQAKDEIIAGLKQELDALKQAAQEAAKALKSCREEMKNVVKSNRAEGNRLPIHGHYTAAYVQSSKALATLEKVGVQP